MMRMEYETLHMLFSLWMVESIYILVILNIFQRNSTQQVAIAGVLKIRTSEKQNTLIWGYFIPIFSNKILILNHCRMSKPICILICHMIDLNDLRKKISHLSHFDSWGIKSKILKNFNKFLHFPNFRLENFMYKRSELLNCPINNKTAIFGKFNH